jgi:hypothetical protein
MKDEGVRKGVPDLCLPVPMWGRYTDDGQIDWYHGLFIEMKKEKGGTVSKEQKEWIELLKKQGYRVEVCKGYEAAVKVLEDYLNPNLLYGNNEN